MNIYKLFVTLLTLLSVKLCAQSVAVIDSTSISKVLDQYAADDSPGMAIGIVKDGRIIYEHYLGYANLEHGAEVNQNTRFNIASNAKQFTALCILQLAETNQLELDDNINIYLPEIHEHISHPITISNLLNHTNGIRDYCELLALQGESWWKQFIDNGDIMELLEAQEDLNFIPGTEYLYSNSNYILLAEIVKKITGMKFSAYARELFESLDMKQTSFLTHYGAIIPNRARPYGNWNGWIEEPTITDVHGDGALFTTLQDQMKWEQIIQLNNNEFLSPELVTISQTPIEESSIDNYGYGLMFDHIEDLYYQYHDGATAAYSASFLRFPSEKLSLIVMSNNRNSPANYIAWQIAIMILDIDLNNKQYPSEPDSVEELNDLSDVTGNYLSHDGSLITITEKEGFLYREIYQRDPIRLIPERGGLFEYETIKNLKMNFTNIGKPKQKFTLYLSSQEPSNYYKYSDLNLNDLDKTELNGRYHNTETDTEILVDYVNGTNYTITKNGRARQAKLVMEDYLRMMSSYEIKIIRNGSNQVTGIKVDNERIKNVVFNKK